MLHNFIGGFSMKEEEQVPEQEDESDKNSKNPDFLWTLPEKEEEQ
jgi:hypothetical protein